MISQVLSDGPEVPAPPTVDVFGSLGITVAAAWLALKLAGGLLGALLGALPGVLLGGALGELLAIASSQPLFQVAWPAAFQFRTSKWWWMLPFV